MKFVNTTPLSAAPILAVLKDQEDRTSVQIVAKAVGRWSPSGKATIHWDDDVPPLETSIETDIGVFPADASPYTQTTCDVSALGYAYGDGAQGSEAVRVGVAMDRVQREVLAVGDRYWERGGRTYSRPDRFFKLSMTWEHAFGGTCVTEDGGEAIYAYNRYGRGYVTSARVAQGIALPNIEDPQHPIRQWSDEPRPCNIATVPLDIPLGIWNRVETCFRVLSSGQTLRPPPGIMSTAHPIFQFPAPAPGARLRLFGMSERPLHVQLPSEEFEVHVQIGPRNGVFPLALENILLLPEASTFVLTWRARFLYRWTPGVARISTLRRRS